MDKREIIQGFEAARAKTFFYMAQALIDELGEVEGRKKIIETVRMLSKSSGEKTRANFIERGLEPSWENHRESNDQLYSLAWDGGVMVDEPDFKIVEYSYCPLGDAFEKLGRSAEELGNLYCSVTDNAFWSSFNPEWIVIREKSLSKDGVCRLVWQKR